VFVLVVGGGKVGYYLAKELIGSGHEVALLEKDRDRARQITDEIGSIVIPHDGCEGKYLAEAGCKGAAYNVRVNVSSLEDRRRGEHLVAEARLQVERAAKSAQAVAEGVERALA